MKILKLENVSKFYKSAETVSVGMQNVSVSFEIGEFVAITGESGSGKSTLLNVISGLDGYEEGELFHYGEETSHYNISDWEKYRSAYIGFVFQNYNIIDSYTVYQNVLFALEMQGYNPKERKKRALELIEKVGLTSHKNHKASKLSGGQKQRAVIARALAKDTPIIVADEPTGNLDSESSKEVMKLLHEISEDKLVIVVTHDYSQIKNYATRKIKMHDGSIVEDQVLKAHKTSETPVKLEVKKISFLSLLRISLRNIFATPKRTLFMLFLQVLVISFFTLLYSSQVKNTREAGLENSHVYPNVPQTRLLIEKRDGKDFSKNEIEKFKQNKNTIAVYENPYLFFNDNELMFDVLSTKMTQFVSKTDSAIILNKKEVKGELPKKIDEVVVSSVYDNVKIGDTIGLRLYSFHSVEEHQYIHEFKVVGLDKLNRNTIYFSEAYLNQELSDDDDSFLHQYIKSILTKNLEVMIDDMFHLVYLSDNESLLYDMQIVKLNGNEAYTEINNKTFQFYSSYEDNFITVEIEVESFGSLNNYLSAEVLINKTLLNEVIDEFMLNLKDKFITNKNLIVVEVLGYKQGDKLIKQTDSELYKVYYPANISPPYRDVVLFIQKLLSGVLLFFVGMFLYSIVHAVSKNVMAARKKDFAIFRSIGTNQKVLAVMVVLEQVISNMFGFIITLIALFFLKNYIAAFRSTLPYMKVSDYFILAFIFLILGIWLGLRFNKKVFNQSVIEVLTLSKGEF